MYNVLFAWSLSYFLLSSWPLTSLSSPPSNPLLRSTHTKLMLKTRRCDAVLLFQAFTYSLFSSILFSLEQLHSSSKANGIFFCLFFNGCNRGIWKFQGQGLTRAAAATSTTDAATLDLLTHCNGQGIKPVPPQRSKSLQSDS